MLKGWDRSKRASFGRSEHDEHHHHHRASSFEYSGRCKHQLIDIVPIGSVRVEGGYKARCLLCGTTGPKRSNSALRHSLDTINIRRDDIDKSVD